MKIKEKTIDNKIGIIFFIAFALLVWFFAFRVKDSIAADCSSVPLNSAWTVSTGCSLPNTKAVWGVDSAGITINTGQTLQVLQTDKKLVWGPGASIVRNGTGGLSFINGSQITQKYICWLDQDADEYVGSLTPTLQSSSTCSANYVRPSALSATYGDNSVDLTTADLDEDDNNAGCAPACYTTFYPSFYPAFYPSFYPAFYPYQTFYPAFYPAFYPSFYPAFYPYQTFYPAFYPTFYPTFYPAFYPYQTFYPAFYPSFYPAFYPGFYPYQSFYPGFYPVNYPGFYPGFYPYQSFYPGCFLEGTQVLMANGTSKNIEDISRGEIVMSYDLSTHKKVANTVIEKYTHPDYPDYLIINESLKVTTNHRIWVNNIAWIRADELKVGDVMSNSSGDEVVVSNIEFKSGSNTVYNLHLQSENHNYFADGVLVHNGKQ